MNPNISIAVLKGVGSAQAKKLEKLGLKTISDLIDFYPRRYEDFSIITPIHRLKPGQVTIEGEIKRVAQHRSHKGIMITEALIDDGTAAVKAVWFRQPYLVKSLPKRTPVFVSGQLDFKYQQYALQSPTVERASDFPKNTARIVPVYPETAGLSSKQLRKLVEQVLPTIKKLTETLPPEIVDSSKLMSRVSALTQIHFPKDIENLEAAKRRIAFEELFYLILTSLIIKQEIRAELSQRIKFNKTLAQEFTANLPFKLTNAQRKAAWQILQDINRTAPMNRLLEGDVGSGKTVVAAMAITMAAKAGYQSAILAPTAVLARQHFETFQKLDLKTLQLTHIKLLTSSVKGLEKAKILAELKSGKIDLIIGTHALLEEAVQFHRLGLVIIDEQHRFGVKQRQVLKVKAGKLPHLLAMSATPIPRSLALTVYGDLDISIINELPAGRKPVETAVVTDYQRNDIYKRVDGEIANGRQVYVICPLVSDSDSLGVKSVESEAKRLAATIFNHRQIGLLHGKLKEAEKQGIMDEFKKGKIDILVSTTVVEVGVDVPNATIIMVEGAERFGLATLHQLRGRVGRGKAKSYCYLFATNNQRSVQRLELLSQYNDGFKLAQKDLELRGPGELYGRRQHGLLDLRMANLSDTKLIAEVRSAASSLLVSDPNLLQYPQIRKRVNQLKAVTTLD